ncbi:methyl-accepting chemotaxis protein [Noviherbaspirillum sp. CPCC 100848]|uniref:Methyl-accepting chemotaxis protein n=1 Tax=Noviherbaspirillum album TaxID=3080276 RepID=A0ABU6JJU2_9BURK|nr:methyl-accepting chemotaxis protein [Noviherbaspirillum sp. CPCC 100848]MEC4723550.1 methyl-accepting chemotaxis protein [Noviherbaspirillum sp. CPCC 100848]
MKRYLTGTSIQSVLVSMGALSSISLIGLTIVAATALSDSASIAIGVLCALMVLLNTACTVWLVRRIVAPLREAVVIGQKMIQGDLTIHFSARGTGEIAAVQDVLKDLKDTLFNIVRDVRSGSIAINTTALSVNSDNATLSARNETQAGSIEETAASLEELAATVKQNADAAMQANNVVNCAADLAAKGGDVVRDVVTTMDAIRSSSHKIEEIIGVIDGIAFQTNILALNAAVEAAHAGEQGRGFAVVASEVRSLAQRSAQAARDIKSLITDSVEKVESGAHLVDEAGRAMKQIVTSVEDVAGYVKSIANSTQEQSLGIQQVNHAMVQFEVMIQENTELVTNALKASTNLKSSAASLSDAVVDFKLGSEIGTADEAVELVKKAVTMAKAEGLQALIEEVGKLNKGKLVYKDLYIGIYGFDGFIKAHGANRHFVGSDTSRTRDKNGKAFIADMITIGKAKGSGWVEYLFAHPTTQEIKTKASYLERFDDVVITCGCYA